MHSPVRELGSSFAARADLDPVARRSCASVAGEVAYGFRSITKATLGGCARADARQVRGWGTVKPHRRLSDRRGLR